MPALRGKTSNRQEVLFSSLGSRPPHEAILAGEPILSKVLGEFDDVFRCDFNSQPTNLRSWSGMDHKRTSNGFWKTVFDFQQSDGTENSNLLQMQRDGPRQRAWKPSRLQALRRHWNGIHDSTPGQQNLSAKRRYVRLGRQTASLVQARSSSPSLTTRSYGSPLLLMRYWNSPSRLGSWCSTL